MQTITKTAARMEGRDAYGQSESINCPYPRHGSSDNDDRSVTRIAWYNGYLEARLADRLPKHFQLEPL